MARQAGLGKSLHEVLESLKPADSWPEAPRLVREHGKKKHKKSKHHKKHKG